VLIIRRSKLHYTASGVVTLVGGRPVHRLGEEKKEREIYILTVYWTVFYTSFGPVIFLQVSSLEKERDTRANYYY